MKNFKVKVFLIAMILFITGGMVPKVLATETTDEFYEFENSYESEAPTIETAELSSTFTSEKEIEVFLKTTRSDIEKIVISGWSGGAYQNYLTSKTATYDELREIYTVTFNLDEIVNTVTNQVENADVVTYFFDACVYGTNNAMSYYNLDNVEYTKTGITYTTATSGDTTTLTLNAEDDGEVAIIPAGEEVTESTVWQSVEAGENEIALTSLEEETSSVQTYQLLYRSAATEEVTSTEVEIISEEEIENISSYQNDETYEFNVSEHEEETIEGEEATKTQGWISYTDTPEIYESTIQGKNGETATATIKINTTYSGILSFDYMVSSEPEFDTFTFEISGANKRGTGEDEYSNYTSETISGVQDWVNYIQEFEAPESGVITLTLTYSKDKNVSINDDKAAIRNLKFTPILPSNGVVVINNGEEYTSEIDLSLNISVEDARYMYISESVEKPEVNAETWVALQENYIYTLTNVDDGEKKIYVWFKDEYGAMPLEPTVATIKLDNALPTTTAPTVESTDSTVKVILNQTDANKLQDIEYGYRVVGTTEYTWSGTVYANEFTIEGLSEKTEYEIVTKASDGIHEAVVSEAVKIKTKISSNGIVITKTPGIKTLEDVDVTITWNNQDYTKKYSLDNENWVEETNAQTLLHFSENGSIYYMMTDGTYETGTLEYKVDNIDREGPVVESVEIVLPKTGKYGIDDEITIKITFNEEVTIAETPRLNIKFGEGSQIAVEAVEYDEKTITYKYKIVAQDGGYLVIESITGGLISDSLNNTANYELPEQTGSVIYAENAAYIASKNKYYATLQNAIRAAGNEETTIQIVANTILRDTAIIKETQNITIDLNGKEISIENNKQIVTAIENNGTLKIIDTTANAGTIKATSENKSAYTIINNNTGKLIIEEGNIEAISNSSSVALESFGVYNKEAGEITLGKDDSTVSNTTPEIKATSKTSVGIKLTAVEGKLNYYDGIIKGTKTSVEAASGASAYTIPAGYMEKIQTVEEDGVKYVASYLSNEFVVTLTMDGKTTSYLSLLDALEKVPADGREAIITMNADETLKEIAKIYNGQNITIDLNGHTIERTEIINGAVYTIINNGTLTLKDETKQGKVQAIANKNVEAYAVYNMVNGDLTIDGAILFASIDAETTSSIYYGLYNEATEKVKFYDGKIYNKYYDIEADSFRQTYLDPEKVQTSGDTYMHQGIETVDEVQYKTNYISSEAVVTLTKNGETIGYSTIHNAIDSLTDNTEATIKMEDSEELLRYINIPENRNIILDLNGKRIASNNLTYGIYTKADNLEIKDTGNAGIILVKTSTNNSSIAPAYGISNMGSGNVVVNGGTIISTAASSYRRTNAFAYGINNMSSGNVIINEGIITVQSKATAYNAYAHSYGVNNASSGSVIVNGGTIESTVPNVGDVAYGINNESSGSVIISGDGTIIKGSRAINILDITAKVIIEGGEFKGSIYIPAGMPIKNSGEYENGYVNLLEGKHIDYRIEDGYITLFLAEGSVVAKLEKPDGTTENYVSIQDAVQNVLTDGKYIITMVQNEFLCRSIEIAEGKNIEIDLNGKEIYSKSYTPIINEGELILNDTSSNKIGNIIGSSYGINNKTNGSVVINDGTLTASTHGIYNESNGDVTINGGNITLISTYETYGIYNAGVGNIIVNGGTITVTASNYESLSPCAYGINNISSGNIIVNGGMIIATTEGTNTFSYARGINNTSNGNITVNGGTITVTINVTVGSSSCTAYGIFNQSDGNISVNGGTITISSTSGHTAYAYGIYNNISGNVTVKGGILTVTGFSYYISSKVHSYGIYNQQKGTIIIGEDDNIIDNKEPIIKGGTAIYLKVVGADVRFYDGILMGSSSISNAVFEYSDTVQEEYAAVNIPENTYTKNGKSGNYYTRILTDKYSYKLTYLAEEQVIEEYYPSLDRAISNAPSNIQTTITLLCDDYETVGSTVASGKNIILDLNGRKIIFENSNDITGITNNGILKIIDSSENGGGTIDVSSENGKAYGIYQHNASAVLTIGENDGVINTNYPIIKGKYYGLYDNYGTLYVYDGYFSGIDAFYTVTGGSSTKTTTYATNRNLKTIINSDGTESAFLVKTAGITIVPENTGWINENQNIKIYYTDTENTNKYQIGESASQSLTTGTTEVSFEVSENTKIYAETIDADGNVIYSGDYVVSNIDKTKPTIESATITTESGTSQTITVTGAKDEENGSGIKGYLVTTDAKTPRVDADWIELTQESFTTTVYKNGTWYVYVIDSAGNVSNGVNVLAQNIDIEAPYALNVEVISPETGIYVAGTEIKFNVNWSEEIVVTNAPILKIRFGNGEIRETTLQETTTNILKYNYTIQAGDFGALNLESLSAGTVKDTVENDYIEKEIELVGSKIDVETRAYIEATNTYYKTLDEAINTCSATATEYTKITLLNDINYYAKSLIINEGQKIEIDLNGNNISFSQIEKGIINKGDLVINDTSANKLGKITTKSNSSSVYVIYVIYNTGKLTVNEGIITVTLASHNIYGIYNANSGDVTVNGGIITIRSTLTSSNTYGIYNVSSESLIINDGKINAMSPTKQDASYGIYIEDVTAKVILEGGEVKGINNGIYIPKGMQIKNSGDYEAGYINLLEGKHIGYRIEEEYVVNFLEEGNIVAKLEKPDGSIENYVSIQDAIQNVLTAEKYIITILQNESICRSIEIAEGKNIEIDLNGKEIYSKAVTPIINKGNLILNDTSLNKSGTITTIFSNYYVLAYGIDNTSSGDVIINGGNLIVSSQNKAYGINNTSSGNVMINGGKITVITSRNYSAFGIYNASSSDIIVNGGEITVTGATYAYGINNTSSGDVMLNGGEIIVTGTPDVYGINNTSSGNVTVNEGKIIVTSMENEYYQNIGYGINNVSSGDITINGGVIAAKTLIDKDGISYGIYISDITAKVILQGGEFKGERGGIYIPKGMQIKNNGEYEAGYINLIEGNHIGYRIEDEYVVNFLEEGNIVAKLERPDGSIENYVSIQDAVQNVLTDDKYTITMEKNEILCRSIEIEENKNIEIELNGKEIYSKDVTSIINKGKLIINDTSTNKLGTITTLSTNSYNAYGINNTSSGDVIVNGGAIIVTSTSSSTCGIVNTSSGGTITLNEGQIIVTGVSAYGINNASSDTITLNEGQIIVKGHSAYGINNTSSGDIIVKGGNITVIGTVYDSAYGIRNTSTGNVIMDEGFISVRVMMYMSGRGSAAYGIFSNNKGNVKVNGGVIISNAIGGSYATYSQIKFTGGKLISTSSLFLSNTDVILNENTYVKKYTEKIDGVTYNVAEIAEVSDIMVTNNVTEEHFSTLEEAMTKANTYSDFTKVTLLKDTEITSDITISSGKNIQLDLNGNTVSYYSNAKEITAFINNGTFEIIDSTGGGKLEVIADGNNAYGICNAKSSSYQTATFKLTGGDIEVTSIGANAYGVYNFYGRSTTTGSEAIRIEVGSISVKAEETEVELTSGIAYGVYNNYSGAVVITGDDTNIYASSSLNDSYGVYDNNSTSNLTISENDGLTSNASPYIVGGTNGIYKADSSTFALYGGSVTGATDSSIYGTVTATEANTTLYTLDNNDGTETTLLLKNIVSIEGVPEQILFVSLEQYESFEVYYLPVDATDVTIDYEISTDGIFEIKEDNNVYEIIPKANGTAILTFTARDITGKSVTATCEVIVDVTPPTDTAPSATSTGTSVTIICNQEDDNLDTHKTMYAISSDGGTTWSDWTNRSTISGLTPDTEYMVKTKATDELGNETESKATTIKTKLANMSEITYVPNTATKEDVTVTITWNNEDNVPQYYKVGSGDWVLVEGETTEFIVSKNNSAVYTKLVYDGTEDSDIKSAVIDNIDRLAPTGSFVINEEKPRYDGLITLNITTADDATAEGDNTGTVAYIYITEENLETAPADDDENWVKYVADETAHPYTIQDSSGDVTIYMWFKDKADNVSIEAATASITYTPPVAVLIEDDVVAGEYASIAEAYTAARTGSSNASTILIYQDTSLTSNLNIASNKNIKLDLNGRTVTSTLSTGITNNGTLEITDSKGNGKYVNTYSAYYTYGIYNNKNLTISGGTIEMISNTSSGYYIYGIYSVGSSAKIEMTGGKVYVSTVSSSSGTPAYAIFNNSSYTASKSMIITGGIVEAYSSNYSPAYGICNASSGAADISNVEVIVNTVRAIAYGITKTSSGIVTLTSGSVDATSTSGTAYGVYNSNSTNYFVIGTNDETVNTEVPVIQGSTYGLYRGSGKFYFYDGVIKGKTNQSISCQIGYLVTPENYGVQKTVEDSIESAILVYDDSAPTLDSIEITNNIDVNTQTITVKGVSDVGTGIVGYIFSNSSTVPTKTSTNWTNITATNGPVDYTYSATRNGTWYFWAIDAAGNVSETVSVVAENIRIRVESITMNGVTVEVGAQQALTATLNPTGSEAKSMIFTSSNKDIVYVHPTTGVVTGVSIGTATITCTVENYDGTYITKTCTVTVSMNPPEILTEPLDRTVKEGTDVEFSVDAANGTLQYKWYMISGDTQIELTEDYNRIYKSNIEGLADEVSTETIILNTSTSGELSFDYMVSSEAINDTFTVTITDASGDTVAVNNISGDVSWTNYKGTFIPNADGQIIITLTYSKNGSVDSGLDYGAIRNLQYYYYGVAKNKATFDATADAGLFEYSTGATYEWVKYTDSTGDIAFKSSNNGKGSTTSKSTIKVKTTVAGTLSFDWMVSSESGWDKLTITVEDKNGPTTPISAKSGAISWTTYTQEVTPTDEGEVIITVSYSKDGSVNGNSDIGSIKNLTCEGEGYVTAFSNYESDDLFEVSNTNWSAKDFDGVNTSKLQIPGAIVTEDLSGTSYYCVVTNEAGSTTSESAILTIAEEEIPVEIKPSKAAPTLEVIYNQIEVTCNQSGDSIAKIEYAISSDGETYSDWQEENVFTNLSEGERYFVKTRVTDENGDIYESSSSFVIIPIYVASLEEDGNITYYENVQDAITAASSSNPTNKSIVKLLTDETRSAKISVASGKNISLDLNGNTLSIKASATTVYGIYNQGKLEIVDNVGGGEIKVSSAYTSSNGYAYGVYNYGGTLVIKGGEISASRVESYKTYAYGVYNYSGTTTIGENDGSISVETPVINSTGYGLYRNNGTVYFYDGVILANKANATYGTVNIATGAVIEEEYVGTRSKVYLALLVVDEETAMEITVSVPANTTIKLPIASTTNLNIIVDFGDGSSIQRYKTTYPSHTYTTAGTYKVKFSGTLDTFGTYEETVDSNSQNFTKYLKTVDKWGELGATRYGFANCTALESVSSNYTEKTFENITSLDYIFYNCTSLLDMEIINEFDSIGNYMFYNCTSLEGNLIIPANITVIGDSAFENCSSFTGNLIIPSTLTSIGSNAFEGCTGIAYALLPNVESEIIENAEEGSFGVVKVYALTEEIAKLYNENSNWNNENSGVGVRQVLELVKTDAQSVRPYSEFIDEGAVTIVGYEEDPTALFRKNVTYSLNPNGEERAYLDTSILGTYTATYTLQMKNASGEYENVMNATGAEQVSREINVLIAASEVILYENGEIYDGNWTNQEIIAVVLPNSSETTWLSVKAGMSEWTTEPSYAQIDESGDKLTVTFSETISGDIYIREVNESGKALTYASEAKTLKIDKEAPIIEKIKTTTTEQKLKLTAKVLDETSKVAYYSISRNEEIAWQEYDEDLGYVYEELLNSGTYYLYLKDEAGNEIKSEAIIAIKDITPPEGRIDIEATNIVDGEKHTNMETVVINIEVEDNQTQTKDIMYAIYNEEDYNEVKEGSKEIEWKAYTNKTTFDINEGRNVIYVVFKDIAGNISTVIENVEL